MSKIAQNIVFGSFGFLYECTLKKHLNGSKNIYVLEPFRAYHHKKGKFRFFPDDLPDYIKQCLEENKLSFLSAKELEPTTIYCQAADRAIEVVESVVPEYRKEHEELFQYVSNILKSPIAENVFKKNLCERLAEFYSVNILLHRIEKVMDSGPILFYPDTNVRSYLYLKTLLSRSNQDFFEHPNIRFPKQRHISGVLENLKENLSSLAMLLVQTVASRFLDSFHNVPKEKKSYSYGITIVSPERQLADTQKGPNFLIDGHKILPEDVVYFPNVELTDDQKKKLAEMPGNVFYLPKPGKFFSHFAQWKKLLWLVLRKNFLRNGQEINGACSAFFNYFRWQRVMEEINIRHFITSCDFGPGHIGRNIALNQAGVQTWYFTDSANCGCNFLSENNNKILHPFWTYLYYDHFVTWSQLLAQYFKDHPGTFEKAHVVGCLWSGDIQNNSDMKNTTSNSLYKTLSDHFVVAVFDTTYGRNGVCSYDQAIAFAEDIINLSEALPCIYVLFKEKKGRDILHVLDPVLGPKLQDFYKKMDGHPMITTYHNQADSSELISISDMVISFPFTSTTFEALSIDKPAIWHDPMDCYRDTPYGKIEGVTTHSYDELKAKVLQIKDMEPGTYQNPIPAGSPLLDPYRDGKAIDRFRDLLISS